MRDIKFRGKRTDNGEWVYGYFYKGVLTDQPLALSDARICNIIISDGTMFHVDPNTVGQFTNRLDKNKKEIYEEDILNWVGSGLPEDDVYSCIVTWVSGGFDIPYEDYTSEVWEIIDNIPDHKIRTN